MHDQASRHASRSQSYSHCTKPAPHHRAPASLAAPLPAAPPDAPTALLLSTHGSMPRASAAQ
eukprot:scaffold2820_cov64-Phaeocystis_antarctica.AAC.4